MKKQTCKISLPFRFLVGWRFHHRLSL